MGRILLWICGAVLAGLLIGAAPPPNDRAKADEAQATRDLTNAVEALSRNVAEQAKAGQTAELERPCEPGQDSRNSDLCAQWKAADSARDAARWALWSTIVGIAGVVGLVWNLRQGRAALDKARDANLIAREHMAADLRAWLCATGTSTDTKPVMAEGKPAGDGIVCTIKFMNSGRTPATNCDGYYEIKIVGKDDPLPTFTTPHDAVSETSAIPPGVPFSTSALIIAGDDHLAFWAGQKVAYLYAFITYNTVMGGAELRVTECCFMLQAQEVFQGPGGDFKMNVKATAVGPQNTMT